MTSLLSADKLHPSPLPRIPQLQLQDLSLPFQMLPLALLLLMLLLLLLPLPLLLLPSLRPLFKKMQGRSFACLLQLLRRHLYLPPPQVTRAALGHLLTLNPPLRLPPSAPISHP